MMRRREFIGGVLLTSAAAAVRAGALSQAADQNPEAPGRIKVTGMKTIGVTWEPNTDRPYVFVKLETDAGIVGWSEATLEGKAGAVRQTIDDLRALVVGPDPMRVEHIWQDIYIHAFYRAGPILGSALSGIDQALCGHSRQSAWPARVPSAGRSA